MINWSRKDVVYEGNITIKIRDYPLTLNFKMIPSKVIENAFLLKTYAQGVVVESVVIHSAELDIKKAESIAEEILKEIRDEINSVLDSI